MPRDAFRELRARRWRRIQCNGCKQDAQTVNRGHVRLSFIGRIRPGLGQPGTSETKMKRTLALLLFAASVSLGAGDPPVSQAEDGAAGNGETGDASPGGVESQTA